MSGVKFNVGVRNYGGLPSGGSGLLAARPAAGVAGRIFIASDTLLLYRDTGAAWTTIGGGGGGITGSGATGQATFWTGASAVSGDNTFFWDNTNKRLGLGTATPGVRLDIHSTNVIAQFNGTTTNSAFLDFQNAGTTRFRIGNDYNGGAHTFALLNNSLTDYSMSVIQSTGKTMFGNNTFTSITGQKYEYYFTNNIGASYLAFANNTISVDINTYKTRGTTIGSYAATQSGDSLGAFNVAGSSGTGFLAGGGMVFTQNGAVGTNVPTNISWFLYNASTLFTNKLQLNSGGYSTFLDRLNVNNATDNSLFALNVNGNTYTGGLSPTILTVGTNTTMAATATGYYCTATLTLTLPSAASINNVYWIIAASGATITVNRAGTDDILNLAGASVTSITITPNQRAMFYVGGGTRTFLISQA